MLDYIENKNDLTDIVNELDTHTVNTQYDIYDISVSVRQMYK